MAHSTPDPVILCAGVVDPYLPGGTEGATHTYQPGDRLEGLPPEWAPMMHDLGVGMMQLDLPHVTTPEVAEGTWDWTRFDAWTQQCRDLGFQIMLFPHWHWPPTWYIEKYGLEGIRCLEHDISLPCFSPWDPATRPWFERCTAALATHTHATGGPPEGFFIGVHGDYGECMFPMGSVEELSDRFQFERGETVAHCHGGFWCGDRFAREDFRQTMLGRYGDLEGLNRTWSADFARAEDVTFPQLHQYARRAWLDFIGWYMGAMTRLAGDVAAIYRHHFPEAVLTVPLGGGVEPVRFGQDNSALARAMVPSATAIRSTANTCCYRNPDFGPVEKFARSYAIVKRIKSACRHYGASMWLEPPYPPHRDAVSVTAGVFEALSCGVTGCLDWGRTFDRQQNCYRHLKGLLRGVDPCVDTAVYFPTSSHRLADVDEKYWGNMPARYWDGCCELRPYRDYDVVDEHLIGDGALGHYKWLLIFEADIVERATLDTLEEWIRGGGIAVVAVTDAMQTVEADTSRFSALLGISGASREGDGTGHVTITDDPALAYLDTTRCEAIRAGQHIDAATTDALVRRGDSVTAWRRTLGHGSLYAMVDGASHWSMLLDFFRGISQTTGHLPGAVDLCRVEGDADAVFVTAFDDGLAVLNLNENPVAIETHGTVAEIPALDITWIDQLRA